MRLMPVEHFCMVQLEIVFNVSRCPLRYSAALLCPINVDYFMMIVPLLDNMPMVDWLLLEVPNNYDLVRRSWPALSTTMHGMMDLFSYRSTFSENLHY